MSVDKDPKSNYQPNCTQVPNVFYDRWQPVLGASQWSVLSVILRKTYGWHKKKDAISRMQFCRCANLAPETVRRALRSLEEIGLVITHAVYSEYGDQDSNLYEVNINCPLPPEKLIKKKASIRQKQVRYSASKMRIVKRNPTHKDASSPQQAPIPKNNNSEEAPQNREPEVHIGKKNKPDMSLDVEMVSDPQNVRAPREPVARSEETGKLEKGDTKQTSTKQKKKINLLLASPAAKPAAKPAVTPSAPPKRPSFSFDSQNFEGISPRLLQVWKEAFPHVDVEAQLRLMVAWILCNQEKARRRSAWDKFIFNWLQKANNDQMRQMSTAAYYQSNRKADSPKNAELAKKIEKIVQKTSPPKGLRVEALASCIQFITGGAGQAPTIEYKSSTFLQDLRHYLRKWGLKEGLAYLESL